MKSPINWQQYGLRTDPFDTLPLVEGGDLKIEQAFIGRKNEIKNLNAIFESENRLCLTICGEVGVGKTSLANFHKYIWKYKKQKLLFSFRREIEASEELLSKRNFLLEIIASVIREIRLLQPELLKTKELKPLVHLIDIVLSANLSGINLNIAGLGGGIKQAQELNHPINLSMASLEEHFLNLIAFLKNNKIRDLNFQGLIVHINNFDVLLAQEEKKKMVINFFNEIRDLLQTPDVYFLFLGPPNFFKDIISYQTRVKGIFYQTPLQIKPLSKTEVAKAIEERMKLLKSQDVINYIKPIEDEVIFALHDLYQGDVRLIMSAIRDILGQCAGTVGQTLQKEEAQYLLATERNERLNIFNLTEEQKNILKFFIKTKEGMSQKDLCEKTGIVQSNMSGYYLRPLKDSGILEEKSRKGKTVLWGLSLEYEPLRWFSKKQEKTSKNEKQQNLFS